MPLVHGCFGFSSSEIPFLQVDFCKPGGYVDQMGYDISKLQAAIEPSR